jgi:hypothetical protein
LADSRAASSSIATRTALSAFRQPFVSGVKDCAHLCCAAAFEPDDVNGKAFAPVAVASLARHL